MPFGSRLQMKPQPARSDYLHLASQPLGGVGGQVDERCAGQRQQYQPQQPSLQKCQPWQAKDIEAQIPSQKRVDLAEGNCLHAHEGSQPHGLGRPAKKETEDQGQRCQNPIGHPGIHQARRWFGSHLDSRSLLA